MEELESFYDYYSRELTYLRQQGIQFAHQYPQVAQRLDFTSQVSSDPHVERLIESFAYLTARLQRDIDDQFPRLSQALLSLLYPQFVNPLPSLSVAEFKISPDKGKLSDLHKVPKGFPLFTTTKEGETCRFQTCYEMTLGPYQVMSASIISPAADPNLSQKMSCARALQVHLRTFSSGFQNLNLQSLRFYLEGSRLLKDSLYEGLFAQDYSQVVVNPGPFEDLKECYLLPPLSLKPVGFEEQDSILPYPEVGHPGYRLLFEYFHFPDKFYFFDIKNLVVRQETKDLCLILPLSSDFTFKANEITAHNFRLHCTPIINLFPKTSEPLHLDHRRHEYRLIGSLHQEATTEIHSIREVKATQEEKKTVETFQPYFSYQHHAQTQNTFWTLRRGPALKPDLKGTDVFLSFVDSHLNSHLPTAKTVFAQTLCTNRVLATEIPVGALFSPEIENPAAQVVCLLKPSHPFYPLMEGGHQWRLISHLSLNYLSLSNQQDSLKALKEIIQLYTDAQSIETSWALDALQTMNTTSVMRRFGDEAWRGFLPGTHIRLGVDLQQNSQKKLFLFTSVLNQFFPLFAGVNSFTELSLYDQNRQGVWKTWSPLAGNQPLL